MPEMKGRSLEELDEIFLNKTPARRFKEYQCTVAERAADDAGLKSNKEAGVTMIEHVTY